MLLQIVSQLRIRLAERAEIGHIPRRAGHALDTMGTIVMGYSTAVYIPCRPAVPYPSVHEQIAAFLDGKTHGEELLHQLYDYVLDEPIPESMRALLER
jgi:hypothetical protein